MTFVEVFMGFIEVKQERFRELLEKFCKMFRKFLAFFVATGLTGRKLFKLLSLLPDFI